MKAPDPRPPGPRLPAPVPDVPEYVADMCTGLIRLAEAAGCDMLAYLLGMARLEAEALRRQADGRARRGDPPPRE